MWIFSNIYCPLKFKYAYMYFYFNPFSIWTHFNLFTYTIILHCECINVHMFQMCAQSQRLNIMQLHFASCQRKDSEVCYLR